MSNAPLTLPQLASQTGRTCAADKPRPSKMGKWRAAVLLGLHIVLALHIAHWLKSGKTLTPLEPSESIYTFTQGYVNAGVVLFALAILSTLVLGRWFCGWGCHVIALQDASTWLLGRLKIRAKPLRSRLLIFVPLGAALYMFAWPIFMRHVVADWWFDVPVPVYQAHFATENFWDTFPGWGGAIVTFVVVGGVIVYFLGNKGFCTYACPYGGFFGVADRFAPGRIRVTDACEQCGHCTAACTSNVRVHEEVNRYGMVVDPGCMKCLDCISVCPKDALYFGFGSPRVKERKPKRKQSTGKMPTPHARAPRQFDFTWGEELLMVAIFFVTLVIVRGLYDFVPFLLALAVGGINAFLVMQLLRTFRERNLRLQRLQLRFAGRTTGTGWAFRAGMAVWLLFLAHSAGVQWLRDRGTRQVDQGRSLYNAADALTADAEAKLRGGLHHLLAARRWGLASFADLEQQIGSGYFYLDDKKQAEEHFRSAVRYEPDKFVAARYQLATLAAFRQDFAEAERQLQAVIEHSPEHADAAEQLAGLFLKRGDVAAVETLWQELVRRRPGEARFRMLLAGFYAGTGRSDEYERTLQEARDALPQEPRIAFELAWLKSQQDKPREALDILTAVTGFAPDFEPAWQAAAEIHTGLRDKAEAAACTRRLHELTEARRWLAGVRSSSSAPARDASLAALGRRLFGLPPATAVVREMQRLESLSQRSEQDQLRLLLLYRAGQFEGRIPRAISRLAEARGDKRA